MNQGRDEHRTFEEMAVAHVLGGLGSERGRLFRAHLLECSDCRARVGELRAIAHDLADVERDERRERAAKAVETKRRADEQELTLTAPPARAPKMVLLVAFGVLLTLAAWNFMLRGQVAALQNALQLRVAETIALEFGEDLPLDYPGPPGVRGVAKRDQGRLVLLLDGLEDREVGVYTLAGGEGVATLYAEQLWPRGGRLLVLVPLNGAEEALEVRAPSVAFTTQPEGSLLFRVRIPPEP
jgi:hypothetical protein